MTAKATITERDRRQGAPARRTALGALSLSVPGRHNLQNALAAVAVGVELGLPFDAILSPECFALIPN